MSCVSVSVSVEPIDEYSVQEITYDGIEKYVQYENYYHQYFANHLLLFRPLSMSENLTKMVQRIDFTKINAENDDDVNVDKSIEESENKELATFQPSLWPWDSVRNKLKYFFNSFLLISNNIINDTQGMR